MIEHLKKSKGGFTLVELIVVIAILAILSGIAVPVYSGYISKANEAGDLQLLGALNTAYTAACAEMGLDPTKVVGLATLSGEAGSKTVSNVTASGSGAVALSGSSEEFFDAFKRYYGDNINTPFKVYESLGYDMANGVFVDGAKEVTVMYNGKPVTVTMAQITAYQASTFGLLGSHAVLDQVDKVVDGAAATLAQMSNPNTYPQFTQGFVAFLKERYGMTDEQISAMSGTERANALVLMVASKAKDLDVDGMISDYVNGTSNTLDLQSIFEGGNATVDMATIMTIPFALAMAYVNSDQATTINTGKYTYSSYYDTQEEAIAAAIAAGLSEDDVISGRRGYRYRTQSMDVKDFFYNGAAVQWEGSGQTIGGTLHGANNLQNTNDVTDMVTIIMDSEGFRNYMSSGQAQTDMQGFVSAMTMLDANAGNIDTADLLANGFADAGLQAMIAAILGG